MRHVIESEKVSFARKTFLRMILRAQCQPGRWTPLPSRYPANLQAIIQEAGANITGDEAMYSPHLTWESDWFPHTAVMIRCGRLAFCAGLAVTGWGEKPVVVLGGEVVMRDEKDYIMTKIGRNW